ncbi:Lrp/AsnC family transcriptional regulator, leucine-responsive regulatory protein [Chryseobacterium taeanense]|uniref:Lrp/AsnC family transcriptional regulator, leucine-responsive regulatory protein n=1 Tax=Chryseobacterium taeanense TaxID=311334 RepID=A0A1G8MQQ0_9FLAO|nr:Lrp/AsnC family transcriptional regulator [Chryseobacterium taeanense]SDI70244.1 Lrp/AsnC family transcriptional regulator, leucine-responsive regulatory protein [Chryseobacterium taeanense]
MKITLDDFDYKILRILSQNSRLSYAEIGRLISLSQSATKERVMNLVDNGIIRRFSVEIDHQKLGYDLKVLISMKFKNDDFRKFIADLEKFPEILNCKRVTGEYCLITECILRDSSHLENLIDRLIPYGIPTTSIQLSEINRQKI